MRFTLKLSCALPLPMETVWQKVSTMEGVNAELMPLLYMTTPTHAQHLPFIEAPVQQVLFPSWLLLFGWIPFDRHYLQLEQVWEGGFRENSHSLVHRSWHHERRIVPDNGDSILTDTLNFEPYIPLLGYILLPVIRLVFQHRHRRLKQWALTQGGDR